MRFSDETLIAYADAELDEELREEVETAMATDSDLADAIALQIETRAALKAKLHEAFDRALVEPIPQRLLDGTPRRAPPPDLPIAASPAETSPRQGPARWSFGHWSAITAALIVGLLIGRYALERNEENIVTAANRMTAGGELRDALGTQRGGVFDRETGIQIGVSYLAKNGEYCRTFTLRQAHVLGGLACRRREAWVIDVLTGTNAYSSNAYRMAGASVPPLILSIVETTIAGEPLDREEETDAQARGWQR